MRCIGYCCFLRYGVPCAVCRLCVCIHSVYVVFGVYDTFGVSVHNCVRVCVSFVRAKKRHDHRYSMRRKVQNISPLCQTNSRWILIPFYHHLLCVIKHFCCTFLILFPPQPIAVAVALSLNWPLCLIYISLAITLTLSIHRTGVCVCVCVSACECIS